MAIDKRVRKTKKYIKLGLIDLLDEKPFEQITVTELCQRSDISRITFYAHYGDKFALVDEMFVEMLETATVDYYTLQKKNNPTENIEQTFCNLLDCILNLYDRNMSLLTHTTIDRNPYMYTMFYSYIVRNVEIVLEHRSRIIVPKYTLKQVSGFICNGLWAFISEADRKTNKIRKDAKVVLSHLLRSEIVTAYIG